MRLSGAFVAAMRPSGALAASVLIAWAPAVAAADELVAIAWDASGRFERRLEVAPGRFAEVCGKLARGDSVHWRFTASAPLDFNVHYHEGKAVTYPARQADAAAANGHVQADADREYCWMWTNKAAGPAALQVDLQR